jgi:hypothetical protein
MISAICVGVAHCVAERSEPHICLVKAGGACGFVGKPYYNLGAALLFESGCNN